MTNIIAEIGINHNGNLDIAKQLILSAKDCGADYVKFQKRDINSHRYSIDYKRHRQSLEFGYEQYKEIDEYCKEIEIPWFVSCWDVPSIEFAESFNLPILKIPSAKITDDHLMLVAKNSPIPILMISTGMSNWDIVDKAYNIVRDRANLVVMHCHSAYPAPESELNLNCIRTYNELYGKVQIGYSGHETILATTVAAVALGAKWIERHITLDRSMKGSDHAASVEVVGFRKLVSDIRSVDRAMGDGCKIINDSELPALDKLRREITSCQAQN